MGHERGEVNAQVIDYLQRLDEVGRVVQAGAAQAELLGQISPAVQIGCLGNHGDEHYLAVAACDGRGLVKYSREIGAYNADVYAETTGGLHDFGLNVLIVWVNRYICTHLQGNFAVESNRVAANYGLISLLLGKEKSKEPDGATADNADGVVLLTLHLGQYVHAVGHRFGQCGACEGNVIVYFVDVIASDGEIFSPGTHAAEPSGGTGSYPVRAHVCVALKAAMAMHARLCGVNCNAVADFDVLHVFTDLVDDARAFTTYQLKPQMRTLGPKYGKRLRAIGEHLANMDGNDVVDAFARGETVSFEIEGETIVLEKDDVLTAPAHKPGFVAATERELTVVLDTNLTPALVEEGFVREVISKIQTMRKDADFDVTDRIAVIVEAGETLTGILEANREALSAAVLASSVAFGPAGESATEWNINGEKARIRVEVAPGKN